MTGDTDMADEIEVTPAMVKAGVAVHEGYQFNWPEDLVTRVYRAMETARREAGE